MKIFVLEPWSDGYKIQHVGEEDKNNSTEDRFFVEGAGRIPKARCLTMTQMNNLMTHCMRNMTVEEFQEATGS